MTLKDILFDPTEGLIQGATYINTKKGGGKDHQYTFIGVDNSKIIYNSTLYVFVCNFSVGFSGVYWQKYGKILGIPPTKIYLISGFQFNQNDFSLYCHPYDPNQEPEDDCL